MSAEAMRAAFEASILGVGRETGMHNVDGLIKSRKASGEYWSSVNEAQWTAWQDATLAERERAAMVCESIAIEHSYGSFWEPSKSKTADECARAIRKGETP